MPMGQVVRERLLKPLRARCQVVGIGEVVKGQFSTHGSPMLYDALNLCVRARNECRWIAFRSLNNVSDESRHPSDGLVLDDCSSGLRQISLDIAKLEHCPQRQSERPEDVITILRARTR
jgi:hypothetical protein